MAYWLLLSSDFQESKIFPAAWITNKIKETENRKSVPLMGIISTVHLKYLKKSPPCGYQHYCICVTMLDMKMKSEILEN